MKCMRCALQPNIDVTKMARCRTQVIESLGCRSALRPKREILKRFPALRFGSGWQPGRGSRMHVRAGQAFLMRVTVSEAGHRV